MPDWNTTACRILRDIAHVCFRRFYHYLQQYTDHTAGARAFWQPQQHARRAYTLCVVLTDRAFQFGTVYTQKENLRVSVTSYVDG